MTRSCVITGVTGELGGFVVRALAEEDWQVIGIGRKAGAEADLPASMEYIQADLSDPAVTSHLPERIGFCPDVILHCAVAYPDTKSQARDATDKLFRANVFAPYELSLGLLERRSGETPVSVIVVNSEAMFNADEKSGLYASSKAALRVLTSALAHRYRGRNVGVSTLLLGPLANEKKRRELEDIARRKGVTEAEITRLFLRKSNANLVIDDLIELASCLACVRSIIELGAAANGMVCRLDGGASGSLI